jgi:hypothetical protein
LAGELVKNDDIRVDVYEASTQIEEVGAGITLWGRVWEALQLMGLTNNSTGLATVVAASSVGGFPTGVFMSIKPMMQRINTSPQLLRLSSTSEGSDSLTRILGASRSRVSVNPFHHAFIPTPILKMLGAYADPT